MAPHLSAESHLESAFGNSLRGINVLIGQRSYWVPVPGDTERREFEPALLVVEWSVSAGFRWRGLPSHLVRPGADKTDQRLQGYALQGWFASNITNDPRRGKAPTAPAMPAFSWVLGDDQVAAVLTYIRNTWGNSAPPVSAGDVSKQRHALVERSD